MASSYTSSLGLEKQADGENANTWGLRLNQSVIDLVDEAVAGYAAVALTSGTQTDLTVSNGSSSTARHASLEFTGNIAATVTVTVPAQQKTYSVINSVTNGGSILIKNTGAAANTGQTISSGEAALITTNGSSIKKVTPELSSYAQISDITDGTITPLSATNATNATFATSATNATNAANATFATSATNATNAANINITTTGSSASHRMVFAGANDTAGNQGLFKDTAANFTYNPSTNALSVGSLTATGDVTAFSDVALKSNIETLDGAKAFAMRGVSFDRDNKHGSGVVAQELEKIAPELVITHDNGLKSVAYSNIVGYLIEAVKHLKKEIEELKAEK
jgi:hypothetical protein